MWRRTLAIGLGLLATAFPAAAQRRGTLEFGAFGSSNGFDNSLGMDRSLGGGVRVGAYLTPSLSVEFEGGGSKADRTLGRNAVNVGVLSARFTAVPLRAGRLAVLLGAGVDHTDTYFLESYGFHALLGAKYALSDALALRLDGIGSRMVHGDATNLSLHVGVSLYRRPFGRVDTVVRVVTAEPRPVPAQADSVSAAETRRLRLVEASFGNLRDSLGRPQPATPSTSSPSAGAFAAMQAVIYFQDDRSVLSDSAKAVLRDKVTLFRSDPSIRILIVGFASQPGTIQYNLALGLRRAEAAKRYLVAEGVNPLRIGISSKGEAEPAIDGTGKAADAANRRGEFLLLMADPSVAPLIRR